VSDCTPEEREASISLTFQGCADHGHFAIQSSGIHVEGVPAPAAMDGFLMSIEEVIAHHLSGGPSVQELISIEHQWNWSEEPEPLPERAQRYVVRLLAHQLLLRRVASRGYGRGVESAMLTLPFG